MRSPRGVLRELRVENLRCFRAADLEPSPSFNLIVGGNASGKTTLLEALFLLGRGASFRAARPEAVVRHGESVARVVGHWGPGGAVTRGGVEIVQGQGVTLRLDGSAATRAALAAAFPCQILHPASHELVRGAPAERRQFLDWGLFHVEPGFMGPWSRYRRALQQRNAALRVGDGPAAWAWDEPLVEAGLALDGLRRSGVLALLERAQPLAESLLGEKLDLRYLPGWGEDASLAEALEAARHRDLAMASSQVGPHRADLRIELRERRVREIVSRGQEKLIAAALTLAQVDLVAEFLERSVTLLVDEPAADLDAAHLGLLAAALGAAGSRGIQVWVTALRDDVLALPLGGRQFHVEHGELKSLP